MLKKYFDWTPSDIAAWERIRAKGFGRFLLWWGGWVFGCGLFLLLGGYYVIVWLWNGAAGASFLLWKLTLTLIACQLGGFVNAVITWIVEERIYGRIIAKQKGDA